MRGRGCDATDCARARVCGPARLTEESFAMKESPVPPRASAAPVFADAPFDVEADIVVVGGGGGGLPAALFARWLGNEVVLLEKARELGGTARKAAFWYWVPNNAAMRDAGIPDPEEDFLRYVARLSRPQHYDVDSPTLGLSEWEFALCRAIYESASPAAELLRERDALPTGTVGTCRTTGRSCRRTRRRRAASWSPRARASR